MPPSRWRPLLAGTAIGFLVLSPASMLGGAWLLGIVDPLGVGVLVGCLLWWLVAVPLLAAWFGG
jgi:hypothetical protein